MNSRRLPAKRPRCLNVRVPAKRDVTLVRHGDGAAGAGRQVAARPRKQRAEKFSYDARLILQRVWAASGGQCGKYLAASMLVQLGLLA